MDWRVVGLGCGVLYGIGMFCVARATPTHGPNIAALLQVIGYVVLLIVMGFGREDLERITQTSFLYGVGAAAMFVFGSYWFFHAISVAPEKAALIEALWTSGFLFGGLLIHFFMKPMTALQWVGMAVISVGVIMASSR